MPPLVGYDSSDDDEDVQETSSAPAQNEPISQAIDDQEPQSPHAPSRPSSSAQGSAPGPSLPPVSAAIGPALPPADDGEASAYPEDVDMDQDTQAGQQEQDQERSDLSQPPSSPYTTARTLIHNLTLPTVPNMDIPPSPPPSPSHSENQAALTAKFDKFLELKREKGTHFNAKIADSHALKNPPLMDKLLGFAGVATNFDNGEGTAQYATTLDKDLWDPACFPDWAYRGPLKKAQEKTQKEKGRERGEAVQFVPPTTDT